MGIKSLLNRTGEYPLFMNLAALPWLSAGRFAGEYFPAMSKRCAICGTYIARIDLANSQAFHQQICAACQSRLLPRTSGFCSRCGKLFISRDAPVTVCLDCRISPPPWRKAAFYGQYDDLLKDLILRFKFHGQIGLCRILRSVLRSCPQPGNPVEHDLIIPMPLHPAKLRQRGFNQSLELAKGLTGQTSARLNIHALIRTRNTPAQHTLARSQRMRNLKGAFTACPPHVRGRSILLVDDILTTGATAHAATRALLRAGARMVNLLVLARA